MSWNRIVDLHVLVDRKSGTPLIVSRLSAAPLEGLEFFQSDHFTLRLWFYESSTLLESPTPLRLSDDTYLVFSGKRVLGLGDPELLFKAENFLEVEATALDLAGVYFYEADLNLDVPALNEAMAALSANVRTLDVAIDIENENSSNDHRLTKQFDAVIRRQVYDGGASPVSADPHYPAAGNLLVATNILTVAVGDGDDFVDFTIPENSTRWSIFGIVAPNEDAPPIGVIDLVRLDDTTIRARLTAATAETGYQVSIYAHVAPQQAAEPVIASEVYSAMVASGASTVDITIPPGDRHIIPLGVEMPSDAIAPISIVAAQRLNGTTARLFLSAATAFPNYEASLYAPLKNP